MTTQNPTTRAARQARIMELLAKFDISSQGQLTELLRESGFNITQATLSRDLDELGAVKLKSDSGSYYAIPGDQPGIPRQAGMLDRFTRILSELVTNISFSANIVVLRTPAGAAQYLASYIDRVDLPEIAGTIAGDDTIFVLARDGLSGAELAEILRKMAGTV